MRKLIFILLMFFIVTTSTFAVGFLRQSTTVKICFGPIYDANDGVTALNELTINNEIVLLSKCGNSFAAKNDANDSAASLGEGFYQVWLNANDTNTVGDLTIDVNIPNVVHRSKDYFVCSQNFYDSMRGEAILNTKAVIDVNEIIDKPLAGHNTPGTLAWYLRLILDLTF